MGPVLILLYVSNLLLNNPLTSVNCYKPLSSLQIGSKTVHNPCHGQAGRDIISQSQQKQDTRLKKGRQFINSGKPLFNYKILNDLVVSQTPSQKALRAVVPDVLFNLFSDSAMNPPLAHIKASRKHSTKLTNFVVVKINRIYL